ncbi:MAG: MFS transporter [Deltaproteobacteria bacterium]|nr:MFS transporter [Deltaproteobacteria bacterium]
MVKSRRGRKLLFFLLYLCEGAPIGYIWWALPSKLKLESVSIENISSLLALVAIPWAFKFLWAPMIDSLRTTKFGFKAWILVSQILMAASIMPLLWLSPVDDFDIYLLLLTLHAFFAATQDVAIDGFAISVTPTHERGAVNAWMQAGMLTGRSIFGALALRFDYLVGGNAIAALLALIVAVGLVLIVSVNESTQEAEGCLTRRRPMFMDLRQVLAMRATWLGAAFALVSGAGFEAVGGAAGPFLISKLPHGTPDSIASVYVGDFYLIAVALMLSGGFVGGSICDRFGRLEALAGTVVALAWTIILTAGIDTFADIEAGVFFALLLALFFLIGVFVAASYALFMDLAGPVLAATQFSAFMGATNLCESWSIALFGALFSHLGYAASFSIMAGISLSSLPILKAIKQGRYTARVD